MATLQSVMCSGSSVAPAGRRSLPGSASSWTARNSGSGRPSGGMMWNLRRHRPPGKRMSLFKKERLSADESDSARVSPRHCVMVVDDEEGNLRVMSWMLSEHYRVVEAQDGRAALELLQAMAPAELPSVIISDQRMPRMCGVELFEHVRRLYPATMRIILTGLVDPNAIIDSVNRAGVFRFVVKPCDRGELLATVACAIDAFERLQGEDRWRDPLTGLPTRQALTQGPRHGAAAVLRVDIDGFGDYNRRVGEVAGDRLLADVAGALLQHGGQRLEVVRWASDEFLLRLPPPADRAGVLALASALQAAIAAVPTGDGSAMTCSIGVCCPGGGAGSADALLIRIAGEALALARRDGGGRVVCLDADASASATAASAPAAPVLPPLQRDSA
jgi:diguanylate cyclase (GGDEF)-like protein